MKAVTLVFAAVCLCTTAFAADSLRSEINKMDAKIAKTLKNKDVEGFKKVVKGGITDDFKYVENGKTQTFDEMVEGMRQGLAMMKKVTVCTSKTLSLKQSGNMATAMTKHTMGGTMMGQDKKMHKSVFSGVSKDVFRKENGKWKMASMTWTNQTMTVDGKKVDPSKMDMGGGGN